MTTTAQIPLTIIEPEKTSKRWRGLSRVLVAYSFLIPWLIGFLGLTLGPTLASLYLSFTNFDLLQDPQVIGLANYQRIFTNDAKFWHSMQVTFMYVILAVPLKLAFALGLAMVLNRGIAGLPFYRALFYLPSLLGASVAIAVLWRQLFAKDGLVNVVLGFFGFDGPSWISNPRYSIYTLVILRIWQFGSPMVIFLAGLRQIPTSLYEAASVDGAKRWRQFRSITIPLLTPIIFFNLVLQIIHAFQTFTQAFVVSGGTGGPADSTLFFSLYLYQRGFGHFDMGYASALAWVLLLIVAAFTAVNFWASKYWVFYDD